LLLLTLGFYGLSWGNAVKYKMLVRTLDSEIARLAPQTVFDPGLPGYEGHVRRTGENPGARQGQATVLVGPVQGAFNVIRPQVTVQKISFVSSRSPRRSACRARSSRNYSIVDLELSQFQLALEESPYFSRVELLPAEKDMYSAITCCEFRDHLPT